MSTVMTRERFIRAIPGRVRVEVFGLKQNNGTAQMLKKAFHQRNVFFRVEPCTGTGRLLLIYDHRLCTLDEICAIIRSIESRLVPSVGEQAEPTYEQVEAELGKEVAATAVTTSSASTIDLPVYQAQMDIPEALRSIPVMNARGRPSAERIPTPLILSVAGLAVLGVKQLFLGRSALARSPGPFYLSGLLAIATGYPLMKRGLQHGQAEKKWNMDVILGTSALALALVRENVIVLAGLSLLHFVNWRREQVLPQAENLEMSQTHLSPTIRSYREKASKWGMILGGATLAITRSPMRALGVLLAANPRPATMAEEYTWKQAQLASHEKGLVIPENGSLPQLSRTHTVLLEDTSLLCSSCEGEKVMVVAHEEEDKVWSMAASLLKKSCHPWKDEVINHAIDTGRTIRTAFQVEEHPEGLKGKVNNVDVLIGTAAFLRENGLECDDYSLEAKRRRKAGYSVQFVVKKLAKTTKCLGLLVKREHDLSEEGKALLSEFSQRGWNVGVIRNQGNIDLALLQKNGVDVDWLSATESELYEKITALRQQEEDVLLVKKANRSTSLEVPAITIEQVKHIHQTIDYARRMRHIVHQHFVITKIWNAAGVLLAIPYAVTAPLVNLIADGLSLVFHSRAKRLSEQEYGLLGEAKDRGPYMQIGEVAAAAAFEGGPCWHAMPQEAVLGQFGVHETHGLCEEQIHFLRSQFGPNQLQMTKPSSWLRSFFGQFQEFTTLILLGASALALVTGGIFDGLAMGTVLLANAAIGTMQEKKAEKVIEALNRFQPPPCKVIREGRTEEISGGELVPGDIVYLEAGDRVPADLRIIQAWNLEVNEAALTGESLPVAKQAEPVEEQLPLPERKSMVYMGTDVTRGKALAVVVKTGMDTEMGHLTSLMKAEEVKATPLQQKVTSISKTFMKGALLVGGLVFATGLLRGVPLMEMISTSITLIASAIPEGLPVTITIALSAGIFRMAKKQSIVRKLSALETLGRTTVICSDKTGTLTKNEMTVKTIATPGQLWMVTGEGYSPDGSIVTGAVEEVAVSSHAAVAHREDDQPDHHPDLDRLVQIGLLCNNSMLEENGGRWLVKGDPTEGALICLARKNGFLPENALSWKRHHEVPFDSFTGRMSVVCQENGDGGDCYLLCKGAVESVLERCQWYQENGELHPLTQEMKREIQQQNERFSEEALRVLGFAYRRIEWDPSATQCPDEEDLIYVGMVGMMDPPKKDVEGSIQEARQLGVKPVMITGDHPITAIAIAKQLGLWDGTQGVLTGHELDRLSDEQLAGIVESISIFARVTPEHKLRIVSAFQKQGHTVAMTGDGVNDTPAIKKADVGIAMGKTGTEVTKETADIILQEDHFGCIVDGVKEGRTIVGNIRKAIGCLLTGNLAEILVTSAAVMAGMPIPLVPIQILLMNLLTDALPAMVLAINPGNKSKQVERQDIVDKHLYQKVVTRGVLLGAGALGIFALNLAAGAPIAAAQSAAFATLVAGQLIQTFSWRQEGQTETIQDWTKDRFLLTALGVSWVALLSVLYIPGLARIFHTAPLRLGQWIPILAVASSISTVAKPILSMMTQKPAEEEQSFLVVA